MRTDDDDERDEQREEPEEAPVRLMAERAAAAHEKVKGLTGRELRATVLRLLEAIDAEIEEHERARAEAGEQERTEEGGEGGEEAEAPVVADRGEDTSERDSVLPRSGGDRR
jgi:hypothetical protein